MSDPMSFAGAKLMLFLGDEVLVLRRDHTPGIPWPGRLDFPGGGREGDETPETCALRETREEVGLNLGPADLVWRHVQVAGPKVNWFFAAKQPAGRIAEVVFGNEGAGWQMMAPRAYLASPQAIPHFRGILWLYLNSASG